MSPGDRFGKLTVLCTLFERGRSKVAVLCDCGVEKVMHRHNVRLAISCGCVHGNGGRRSPSDMGAVYGRLTVIAEGPPTVRGTPRWLCRCECGNEKVVAQVDLRNKHTQSCGCYRLERVRQVKTIHGGSESPEYRIWSGMRKRCYDPNDGKYADYGGRGIQVCDEWRQSFAAFLRDVGPRPSVRHSLDRKENNGNYEPGNCRWATAREQAGNKRNNVRVVLDGELIVAAEAARRLHVSYSSLHQRVKKNGGTLQQAVEHFATQRPLDWKWQRTISEPLPTFRFSDIDAALRANMGMSL